MVWWAYREAGVAEDISGRSIGTNTYTQIFNGSRTDCDLSHLNGPATTCWAPGDLVFMSYPGGQHVAMYVDDGLFIDCYGYGVGCILHDISQNSFYQRYFWQARRVLPGCESLAIDPGELISDPEPVVWESVDVPAPDGDGEASGEASIESEADAEERDTLGQPAPHNAPPEHNPAPQEPPAAVPGKPVDTSSEGYLPLPEPLP
jgi:hypothetical protein